MAGPVPITLHHFTLDSSMIDLTASRSPSAALHAVPIDPGVAWTKDGDVAIEVPPDNDVDPLPEAQWPRDARRTGICGVVSPRIVALPQGGYRMYYSQILPRPGFPAGANDYDHSATRILSAISEDGMKWTPEPGVRLSPQEGGAGDYRVVSSEVVPIGDGSAFRMYYECCSGPQSVTNSIRSAISTDGLKWTQEPGTRLETPGHNYAAPRLIFLSDGRCRLYCYDRGHGIISAVSQDGLNFAAEPGLRIAETGPYDSHAAFAPEVLQLPGGDYVMFYAGYGQPNRAYILRATSADGLIWHKEPDPVIAPGPGGWDAAKCSEMCIIRLPDDGSAAPRFRIFYEACDGTAAGERGVWRIATATSAVSKQN